MRLMRSFLLTCALAGLSAAAPIQAPIPINVRDYGATGDGVADDTVALKAAIVAAQANPYRALLVPSGTYRFTDTLAVSSVSINCQGPNNTFLVFDDVSGTKDGMTIGQASFNMSGCNYDRKQNGTGGALFHFTDSYFSSIYNNRFDGPRAYNVITVDSAAVMPNTIFVHDNIVHNFVNDFVFLNSQNPSFPVNDFHAYNNFSSSAGRAHYEVAGFGQIELHGNTMTGRSAYDVYINTLSGSTLCCGLSNFEDNDFDTATVRSLYVNNQGGLLLAGNILGAVSLIAVQGAVITGNEWSCGSTGCDILIKGSNAIIFSGNSISGQNNPITIQPNGLTPSIDLNFAGNTWLYGSGSFLTFSGVAPAAHNVTVLQALQGGETLATFTTPPTNFRNLGSTSGPDAPPTIAACTGVGAAGSCVLSPGATNEVGTVSLNTAGRGEGATGIVTIAYSAAVGPLGSTCTLTPQNSSGFWLAPVSVIQDGTTPRSMQFHWVNGRNAALSDGVQYNIEYTCRGF